MHRVVMWIRVIFMRSIFKKQITILLLTLFSLTLFMQDALAGSNNGSVGTSSKASITITLVIPEKIRFEEEDSKRVIVKNSESAYQFTTVSSDKSITVIKTCLTKSCEIPTSTKTGSPIIIEPL
jgi:hypothetical protein